MKSYATVGATSMFAALTAAFVLVSMDATVRREPKVDVDPITSSSIAKPDVMAEIPKVTVRFTVSNLDADTVCLVERGAIETARSSEFSAEMDCGEVWPGLETARNWIENGDGSVTLTDAQGLQILTMGSSRGFDYATIEPSGVDITWLELP